MGFYLDLMPFSFPLGTRGFAQIQQDLASGGLRAWHFGLSHRIDFDPSGPYGRKMLFASIVSLCGGISVGDDLPGHRCVWKPERFFFEEDLRSEVASA